MHSIINERFLITCTPCVKYCLRIEIVSMDGEIERSNTEVHENVNFNSLKITQTERIVHDITIDLSTMHSLYVFFLSI